MNLDAKFCDSCGGFLLPAAEAAAEPDPDQERIGDDAERRQLTVMFGDLVGSTKLSQCLDPEDLQAVMNDCLNTWTAEIERYEGHIARYMGDGFLAYFGFPRAHEDDAERAVRAGLGVLETMSTLSTRHGGATGNLSVRVGIATGLVLVGDLLGDGESKETTVAGETPNLASRLQHIAGENSVLISETTKRLVGSVFECMEFELEPREVRGFSTPQTIWRVIREGGQSSRFDAARRQLTPLVGREEELAATSRRWALAREGEGQVLLLSGEPGIGKSRLAESFLNGVAGEVFRFQCSPYHTSSALYPVIQELSHIAGFEPNEPMEHRLGKLERLLSTHFDDTAKMVPVFATLLSVPLGEHYKPVDLSLEQIKRRIFDGLVTLFRQVSQAQPTIMLFEDLHWIDPSSKELLDRLISEARTLPLFLVLTFRPTFPAPWVGQAHVSLTALNRLARRECLKLIEGVSGNSLSDELVEQVVSRTDGVPLFLEEFTRTILTAGVPGKNEKRGHRPFTVPETLLESLMARLDQLTTLQKRIAQSAAIIGREFTGQLLASISDHRTQSVADTLAELIGVGIISGKGGDSYTFKHALVQEAAYQTLLKRRRRELHARIAKVLVHEFPEISDTQPELVAHHFTEAGSLGDAIDFWCRAGKRASERCAYLEAEATLHRGLDLLSQIEDKRERAHREIDIRVLMATPLRAREGSSSRITVDNTNRAVALCDEYGLTTQLFPALWGHWQSLSMRSMSRDARAVADRLVQLGESLDDTGLQLESHHCQWGTRFLLGELTGVLHHTQIGIEMYQRDLHHPLTHTYGGHDPGVCAYAVSGIVLWLSGYPEQSNGRIQGALKLAEDLEHRNTNVLAVGVGVYLAAAQQHVNLAAERARKLREIVTVEEYVDWEAMLQATNAWIDYARGSSRDYSNLQRLANASLRGNPVIAVPVAAAAASEMGKRNEVQHALTLIDQALERVESSDIRWFEAELHRVKGELLGKFSPDKTEAVEQAFEQARSIAREQGARTLELRASTSHAQLWRLQGKNCEARDLLRGVYEGLTEGFDTSDVKEAKSLLDQLS